MRAITLLLTTSFLLAASFGCGGAPPPTEKLTTAEAAIRGAQEVGSAQVPRAALHLKLAREQADKAKRLIQDGYHQRAELAVRRAQADAELAIAIAKETQTIERAKKAQAEVRKLKAQGR